MVDALMRVSCENLDHTARLLRNSDTELQLGVISDLIQARVTRQLIAKNRKVLGRSHTLDEEESLLSRAENHHITSDNLLFAWTFRLP